MTTLVRNTPPALRLEVLKPRGNGAPHLSPSPGMLGGHRVSVVVPCMNEAENLPLVLPRIPDWVSEVVVVDDHCTDNTVAVARRLLPDVVIARNERAPGKGNALLAGVEAGSGSMIVQLDADGSEDPDEIHAFVGALLAGADYAKGSRFVQGGGSSDISALRRAGNAGLTLLARVLFPGTRFTDLCYGYNAYRRDCAELLLGAPGFEVEARMNVRAQRAGLRISEVPSFEADRVHGTAKLRTWRDGWRVLRILLSERLSTWTDR
jgi:glycosyltransferase involved in cell wall biosynthesis